MDYVQEHQRLTKYFLELGNFEFDKVNYFLNLSITDFHDVLDILKAETAKRKTK